MIKNQYSVEELIKLDRLGARAFADKAHTLKNQKYDGLPYVEGHLDKVARFYLDYGIDPVILAGIYLHDTKEDTDVTSEDLIENFGGVIARIVNNVTDGEGNNREERQLKTYVRLRDDEDALIVKLCDRGTNMSLSKGTKHLLTYLNEYSRFKGMLYGISNPTIDKLWLKLDSIIEELKQYLQENTTDYLKMK